VRGDARRLNGEDGFRPSSSDRDHWYADSHVICSQRLSFGAIKVRLTNQTIWPILPPMLNSQVRRLLDAYPAIYLACHRQHLRENEGGKVITERQASVLNHLHATRPTSLSKLAEHMGVGRSTMSIAATRLTREGYIARCRDKHDGRSVGLTLTSAGMRIKEQNTVLDAELMKEMFLLMSSRELESALHGIESLAKYAKILLRRRSRGRRP